jgi:hypothetical protein
MVLLEQYMDLDSLSTTSGWPPLYASSGTPIQALHNKCSPHVHISTYHIPMDQTPGLSQRILTSAYA